SVVRKRKPRRFEIRMHYGKAVRYFDRFVQVLILMLYVMINRAGDKRPNFERHGNTRRRFRDDLGIFGGNDSPAADCRVFSVSHKDPFFDDNPANGISPDRERIEPKALQI